MSFGLLSGEEPLCAWRRFYFPQHMQMMRWGRRSGFLHCAAHDDAVSGFGRNDIFLYSGKRTGNSNCFVAG
jgi:hypothetical protein